LESLKEYFGSLIEYKNILENRTFNYYIIRHGDGYHNNASFLKKIYSDKIRDALLTDDGIKQTRNASEKLIELLKGKKINYLFASDLKRTIQTMSELLKKSMYEFNKNTYGVILTNNIINILSCAHELNYIKDSKGNCDNNQGYLPSENKSKCTDITKIEITNFEIEECPKVIDKFLVNWTYYDKFYKGTRNNKSIYQDTDKKLIDDCTHKLKLKENNICKQMIEESKRQQCRNTDMIKNSIKIIVERIN